MSTSPVKLSTFDNPFSPFSRFDEWLSFDNSKGYGSISLLARTARVSSQLTDEENEAEENRAIDEIIKYDFMNVFEKVSPENYDKNGLREAKSDRYR
ncbi:MAG: hypothetical protein J5736_02140 [Bacilli bacterium]|nr:hypothetical protein [Bacilli bacterium]